MQAYSIPDHAKEVQDFVGIWSFCRTFIPHLAQYLHPLYHLEKKGHIWNWGSEHQVTFEKAKILVKQIKALGLSQAGLPFELDMAATLESKRQQEERVH